MYGKARQEASGDSVTPATEGGGEEGGQGSAGMANPIVLTPDEVVHFMGGRGVHTVVWSPAATPSPYPASSTVYLNKNEA